MKVDDDEKCAMGGNIWHMFWRWLVETPHKVDANLPVRLCGIRKETWKPMVS